MISWPGTISITRTRPPSARIANASPASGADAHRLAHPVRDRRARERLGLAGRRDEHAVLVHARGVEVLEVVEQHEVGAQAGRDRAAVEQAVAARRVQRRHQQRVLGRDPLGDGDPAHLVDVALAEQQVGLAVVGAERAVLGPVPRHQRQQVAQVARVRRLADQHPHAAAALLERLCERRRLVVGADAGGDVGVERAAGHARGVAVGVAWRRRPPAARARPASPAMTPGKFIISATPSARGWRRIASMSAGSSGPLGRLEVARRHARRRHHEHVERQVLGRLEHPLHARAAEHVRDLVRVGDDRGGAVRHDRAGELGGRQLGRLDVHVRVDEPRHEVLPAGVHRARRRRTRRARRSARRRPPRRSSSHSRVNTEAPARPRSRGPAARRRAPPR